MDLAEMADRAAAGHRLGWESLRRQIGRGWLENEPGFTFSVTEVPVPSFNGAAVYGDFDPRALTAALGRVADSGFPYCLQARPAVTEAAAEVAVRFGMEPQPGTPLMVTTEVPVTPAVDGLTLRELRSHEGPIHASIVAEAFGAPAELLRWLATPAAMSGEGVHVLAGDYCGQAVGTAIADVNGKTVGIYNVGTRTAHRGRGIGAAVTAAAMRAGFGDGADLAFLLSSPMGERVYARLGFQTLEHWSSWIAAPGR